MARPNMNVRTQDAGVAGGVAYVAAALAGLGVAMLLPWSMVQGRGIWLAPTGDVSQSLIGHLAFQLDVWRFPIFWVGNLMLPTGINAALLDANPLVSLFAKLLPGGPHNLLGAWLFLCFAAMPPAALFALRSAGERRLLPGIAVGLIAAQMPSLWDRVGHINLCGHALVLLGLGMTLRLLSAPSRQLWAGAFAILVASLLIHPYFLAMNAALLAAVPLQAFLSDRRAGMRAVRPFGAVLAGVVVVMALSGFLGMGSGDRGFGLFSMNLLSPVWPQRSGLFGGGVLDPTGGQYEGFNYLGAGILGLVALAVVLRAMERRPISSGGRALLIVAAGLTLLALSSRIYAGHWLLLDLGLRPWQDIFSNVRASGRLFWPVAYAALILAVAYIMRRLDWRLAIPVVVAGLVLQTADAAPVREQARASLAKPNGPVAPPAWADAVSRASLVGFAPSPGCIRGPAVDLAQILTLAALRGGAAIVNVGAARAPPGARGCGAILSDLLETPIEPGELRVFLDAALAPDIDARLLGSDLACAEAAGTLLCGRGSDHALLNTLPRRSASVRPPRPQQGEAFDLRPFLGTGWTEELWTSGHRSTLLVPGGATLDLTVRGIALRAGGTRVLVVAVDDGLPRRIELPDMVETSLQLTLPSDPARITIDIPRPVAPERRGLPPIAPRVGLHVVSARLLP